MTELLHVKRNPLSTLFFVLSAGVFLVAQLTDPERLRFLAFDSAHWPQRWYAIVTYGFVHVDWNHIIVNMLLLGWIGTWVERMVGSRRFLLIVLTAITAGGVSLLVRQTAGIGFSAAAAALLFYYHFAFPWKREILGIPNVVIPLAALIISVGAVVFGWMPTVGHVPHLAGAAVGLLFLALFKGSHRAIEETDA